MTLHELEYLRLKNEIACLRNKINRYSTSICYFKNKARPSKKNKKKMYKKIEARAEAILLLTVSKYDLELLEEKLYGVTPFICDDSYINNFDPPAFKDFSMKETNK